MMRIVFLDIDEVLNSEAYWDKLIKQGVPKPTALFEKAVEELDIDAVKLVSDFCDEMDACVVLSTSWRLLHSLKEMQMMFMKRGWGDTPFLGVTPYLPNKPRGDEIIEWLKKTHYAVESYVILDDGGDFHSFQPLVQTTKELGIQPEHIEKARQILLSDNWRGYD